MDNKIYKDRVTIYEVAKKAGVSLATVSRVINNTGNVSKETAERVNSVIAKLGFQPSSLAQGLAKSQSKNIAIVVPSANYVFISNFINGVIEASKEYGTNVTLFTTSHNTFEAISIIEKVIKSHADGVIIFDDELNTEDVQFINSFSVPCIVINHNFTSEQTGCITFNHTEVMKNIIRDNTAKGGKSMTFVHSHKGGRLLNSVEKAFKEEHEKEARSYQVFNCDDSYNSAYLEFFNYFKMHKSGYFVVYRDSLGGAITNAALDSGLKVPEDVEVISIIGTKYSHILRPQISSMYLDFNEIGKKAAYMLADLIRGNLTEKVYQVYVKYDHRDTTL